MGIDENEGPYIHCDFRRSLGSPVRQLEFGESQFIRQSCMARDFCSDGLPVTGADKQIFHFLAHPEQPRLGLGAGIYPYEIQTFLISAQTPLLGAFLLFGPFDRDWRGAAVKC
ncbi:MAG TPA: hypothetical protein VHU79_04225 [Sphingomicrobium sp.]|jgi:hypothetical protein|nr:hypothetical protein [Sphingomicrobium sp.]